MSANVPFSVLDGLDDSQLEATRSPRGPLLVAAGAGSGKTRVLAHRAAWFVAEQGIPPERVMAVTFTKKAAEQMRARIATVLGPATGSGTAIDKADSVHISTVHSACATQLRQLGDHVDVGSDYEIIEGDDALRVFRKAVDEFGGPLMKGEIKDLGNRGIRTLFSQLGRGKAQMFTAAELARSENPYQAEFGQVWLRYQQMLRGSNLVDFEDLICLTVEALESNAGVRERFARKWDAILVDEAQDLSAAQYRWVLAILGAHQNLTLVGDPSQSIYSFRGADPSQLAAFEDHFPTGKVVKLATNYRCSEAVVAHARRLLDHDKERIPIDIVSGRGERGEVALRSFADPEDEAKAVAAMIVAKSYEHPLEEMAVLARSAKYLEPIEDALKKADISFALIQDIKFWDDELIRMTLAFLRLAVNPGNEVIFTQAVKGWPGLGDASAEVLVTAGRRKGDGSYVDQLARGTELGLNRSSAQAAIGLHRVLNGIEGLASRGMIADAMNHAVRGSGALTKAESIADPRQRDRRLTALRDLWQMAHDYEEGELPGQNKEAAIDIFGLLDELATIARSSAMRRRSVTLGTVHGAKGLEWEVVFMIGLAQDNLPSFQSLQKEDGKALDEERRIAYVALTRGGFECHISYATQQRGFKKEGSQFLTEMGIHTPIETV